MSKLLVKGGLEMMQVIVLDELLRECNDDDSQVDYPGVVAVCEANWAKLSKEKKANMDKLAKDYNDQISSQNKESSDQGDDEENEEMGSPNGPKPNSGKKRKKDQTSNNTAQKKVKKPKDPNAPKKPLSSFFIFSGFVKERVKGANPDFGITQIATEVGRMWKMISEEEKAKYVEAAEKEKQRYQQELAAYNASKEGAVQ